MSAIGRVLALLLVMAAPLAPALAYVEVDTRPGGGQYLCGAIDRNTALSAAATVAEALQYLPDAAFGRLRLRYIVLCRHATAAGQNIGGIPVPPLDLLMLDAGNKAGNLLHTTLHELYHLFEYRVGSYGETHPHEERAELFAFMLMSPGAVAAQASRDPVLRRKADYVADKCERQLGVPIALPR